MPELITVRRRATHGTDATRALASGFGAPRLIRPSTTGGVVAATATTPTSSGSSPAATGLQRPTPGRRPGAAPSPFAAAPTSAPAPTLTTAPAPAPAGAVRRLTVAPPRISVAPQQPAPAAPPVPEVARRLPAHAAPDGQGRPPAGTTGRPGGSLLAATAHLFAGPTGTPTGTTTGTTTAAPTATPTGTPGDAVVVRRQTSLAGGTMSLTPAPPPAVPPPPSGGESPMPGRLPLDPDLGMVAGPAEGPPPVAAFDAIVDAVVRRLERRVIDELERRGRAGGRGF